MLREANRLLSSEGRFYLTIPSDRLETASFLARALRTIGLKSWARRYEKLYNRFWRHHHAYDEVRWRALFAQAGFEVIEEKAYISRNLSTLTDLLTLLAIPSWVTKKLANRWIVCPPLRRKTAGVVYATLSPLIERLRMDEGGCLMFYALKKLKA